MKVYEGGRSLDGAVVTVDGAPAIKMTAGPEATPKWNDTSKPA